MKASTTLDLDAAAAGACPTCQSGRCAIAPRRVPSSRSPISPQAEPLGPDGVGQSPRSAQTEAVGPNGVGQSPRSPQDRRADPRRHRIPPRRSALALAVAVALAVPLLAFAQDAPEGYPANPTPSPRACPRRPTAFERLAPGGPARDPGTWPGHRPGPLSRPGWTAPRCAAFLERLPGHDVLLLLARLHRPDRRARARRVASTHRRIPPTTASCCPRPTRANSGTCSRPASTSCCRCTGASPATRVERPDRRHPTTGAPRASRRWSRPRAQRSAGQPAAADRHVLRHDHPGQRRPHHRRVARILLCQHPRFLLAHPAALLGGDRRPTDRLAVRHDLDQSRSTSRASTTSRIASRRTSAGCGCSWCASRSGRSRKALRRRRR